MTSNVVRSVLYCCILCYDNYEPRVAICRLSRVGPTDRCCAARARAPAPTLCWGGGREGHVTVALRCRCVSCIHCLQPARHILSIQADFTFLADFSLDTGHSHFMSAPRLSVCCAGCPCVIVSAIPVFISVL